MELRLGQKRYVGKKVNGKIVPLDFGLYDSRQDSVEHMLFVFCLGAT